MSNERDFFPLRTFVHPKTNAIALGMSPLTYFFMSTSFLLFILDQSQNGHFSELCQKFDADARDHKQSQWIPKSA